MWWFLNPLRWWPGLHVRDRGEQVAANAETRKSKTKAMNVLMRGGQQGSDNTWEVRLAWQAICQKWRKGKWGGFDKQGVTLNRPVSCSDLSITYFVKTLRFPPQPLPLDIVPVCLNYQTKDCHQYKLLFHRFDLANHFARWILRL